MKKLEQLHSRNLQIELNRGATIDELCATYGATREEMTKHIRGLYSQSKDGAKDIFGRLKRNEKNAKKKREVQVNTAIIEEAETVKTENMEAKKTEAVEEKVHLSDLEEYQKQAKALSDEVVELEVSHERLRNRRAVLKAELAELLTHLTRMRKEILEINDQYVNKAADFNRLGEEMTSISDVRSLKVGQLDELNAKIEQLSTIEIFIYDDGGIVAENCPDIILDDGGHETIYSELLHSDRDYLDLKKSQLLTLAKLIRITDNIKSNVELSFDDEDIELAYGMFRDEEAPIK